jgi:hypothetical protein
MIGIIRRPWRMKPRRSCLHCEVTVNSRAIRGQRNRARSEARTRDIQITNLALYPAELSGQERSSYQPPPSHNQQFLEADKALREPAVITIDGVIRENTDLRARVLELEAHGDRLMERSALALHIADGDEAWGSAKPSIDCPMLASVFALRENYESARARVALLEATRSV